MEVVLIVNPFASGVSEARVEAVERELQRVADVRRRVTERPSHGAELAAEVLPEQALVVFSGDGGFNEVLNGVSRGVPVGFLPGGGTSVLSRALGLPRDPVAAARQVAEALETGRERRISLGRVNGRRFGFSAGIGLDAELVRRVDALGRRDDGKRPGDFAYLLAAARLAGAGEDASSPRSRCRAWGERPSRSWRTPTRTPTQAACPCTWRPRHGSSSGSTSSHRRGSGPPTSLDSWATRSAARGWRARATSSTATISTGSRSQCDRPLPLQADGEDLGDVEEAVFEAERDAIAVLI